MIVYSVVLCVCCRPVLLGVLRRWSEFSVWIVVQLVLLYSEDDMVVMPGDIGVHCLALWSGYLC